ncbi:putative ABC transporter permease [Clostridium sp. MSJ-8]|uniref:putative ABC transporter permease n=1 Tax=Clostridium sp. MSJ-8 TaxID=2841510 RepID=UPI001C0EF53C|nr:putative ABC transporter permease [Clostridium sp. MSJ-8]MBU5488738.1 putative ABC transporter permease [Clostridium sp. MSJ-8]
MGDFLIIAFLFFIGSLIGWCLEVIFRRFFSDANPERKWINPGFLVGPYLPLYGFSLCVLYILAHINVSFIHNKVGREVTLFILMAIAVTIVEYIAGLVFIKGMKVKLWDYTNEWGNIQGIICPKFSFFWVILSAVYYFLIHPHIINALTWLSVHLSFSFVVGFFYGVFAIDLCYSLKLLSKIKKFADDYQVVVKYEALRESIRKRNEERSEKRKFMLTMRSETTTFAENLKQYLEQEQAKIKNEYEAGIKKLKRKK